MSNANQSSFNLLPAVYEDAGELSRVCTAAFQTADPKVHELRWGHVSQQDYDAFQLAEFQRWLTTPHIRIFKAVKQGAIIGFSLWFLILDPEQAAKDDKPMTALPKGVSPEVHFFYSALEKQYKAMTMPRVYLFILVVRPDAQRQGVGKALLAWGDEQATKYKLPLNLEASPDGFPLYQAKGYRVYMDPIEETPGHLTQVMVKLPPSEPFVVERASIADLDRLSHIYKRAFEPTSLNQAIFGQVDPAEFEHAFARGAIEHSLRQQEDSSPSSNRHPVKMVFKATCAQVTVGFAVWEHHPANANPTSPTAPHDQHQETVLEKSNKLYPAGTNVDLARALFKRRDPPATYEYWHLALLAVDPSFQKCGIAKMLLEHGINRAVALPIHLVSTGDLVAFYRSFGFREDGPAHTAGGFSTQPMIRAGQAQTH